MTFKWSSIDKALLPALSGVVKNLFDGANIRSISICSKYFGTFFIFSVISSSISKTFCTFADDHWLIVLQVQPNSLKQSMVAPAGVPV